MPPKMKPIALFTLPEKVRELVVCMINPLDILKLAELSRRMRKLISTSKIPVYAHKFIQMDTRDRGDQIDVEFHEDFVVAFFFTKGHTEQCRRPGEVTRSFGGLPLTMIQLPPPNQRIFEILWQPRSQPLLPYQIFRYLTALLPGRIHLHVSPDKIASLRSQKWIKQCHNITFLHHETKLYSDSDIDYVFKNIKIIDKLYYNSSQLIHVDKIKNINVTQFSNGVFVNLAYLMRLDSFTVWIENPDIPPSLVLVFLKNWQRGSNKKLRNLRIHFPQPFDVVKVDDLKARQWDPKKRPRIYHYKYLSEEFITDCRNFLDILRPDGTRASFRMSNDRESHSGSRGGCFEFFVWNEESLKMPKVEKQKESKENQKESKGKQNESKKEEKEGEDEKEDIIDSREEDAEQEFRKWTKRCLMIQKQQLLDRQLLEYHSSGRSRLPKNGHTWNKLIRS